MVLAAEALPDRRFFRAAEVCELAGVPPYVLKSWELEFTALAGQQGGSGARVYSRAQVELVLQIKEFVFDGGLTLGAARREIERLQQATPRFSLVEPAEPPDMDVQAQLAGLERDVRELLDLLESDAASAATQTAGDR